MRSAHMGIYAPHMARSTTASEVVVAVRQAIAAKGITQVALSEATKIPRTTLQRRLDGYQPFNVDELARIADCLGCTLLDFTRVAA